jgi:hypothetical protein
MILLIPDLCTDGWTAEMTYRENENSKTDGESGDSELKSVEIIAGPEYAGIWPQV